MKRICLVAAAFSAWLLLPSCTTPPGGSEGKGIQLIDGRSLGDWKFVAADPRANREATWSVRDGLLICSGEPIGFICTERKFTNFRMTVEYRWAPGGKPGNSGVFSRINDVSRPLPRCVEVQLMHGNAGDILTLQGMVMEGVQERSFEVKNHELAGDIRGVRKIRDAENPPGEWNRVEILAEGPNYIVWMNGQRINTASGLEIQPGFVGLQSEGGEIHFRQASIVAIP